MPSLIELLSDEDKRTVKSWSKSKLNPTHKTDIPPELYIVAELGYYFGWEAIVAVRRGYIEHKDEQGKSKKSPFTLDEAIALIKAAQKVWYKKIIEQGDIAVCANLASRSKKPSKSYHTNTKGYREASEV